MPNKPLTPREEKAWNFAKECHEGQIRKFVNKPYFEAHVMGVNGILKKYTKDEDLLIASLLHDVVEDCFETHAEGYRILNEMFGEKITSLVQELTSVKHIIETTYSGSKTEYLIHKLIHMSENALTIKLADRLQNVSDLFTSSSEFRNKYFQETISIITELKKNRRLNKIQVLLLYEIKAKLKNTEKIFKIKRYKDI